MQPEVGMNRIDTDIAEALAHTTSPGISGTLHGSRASPAVQRVYGRLRERIISLDLPPNTVLSRASLAREYEVSQTPLREALQKLEAEGLVHIYPQSRTMVSRLVTSEIHEAHFLRVAVETEVMRRLCISCDPAVIKRLQTIVTMQETLARDPEELQSFQKLDDIFHQTLFAAVGQPGLHGLLQSRSGHLNRLRRLDLPGSGKIAHVLQDHRTIIGALEAADPEAAQDAIREHLSQTVKRVEVLRAEKPEYFA